MSVQQPDSSTDHDPVPSTADSSKNDVVVSTDDEKSSGGPSSSDNKIGDVGNDQQQESSLNPDEVPGTTPSSYSSSSTEQPAEAEVPSSSTPPSFSNGRNRQQSFDTKSGNREKSAHSKFGKSQAGKSGAFVEVRGSSSSSSDEPGVVDNRKARVLTIFPVIADGDVPVSVTCPSATGPTSRDGNKVISLFAPGGEGKYFHETITTESVFYEEKSPDGATKTDYKKTEERNSMGGETFGSGDIYTPYSAQEEKRLKDYNNRQRYFAGWCTIV